MQNQSYLSTNLVNCLTCKCFNLQFADDNFKFCRFFKNNKEGMIFHENCLLAGHSHEISYLIFFRKLEKTSQNMSSAAVVIGALRVNTCILII